MDERRVYPMTKYYDVSQLSALSRREMVKGILDARDRVVNTAGLVSQRAIDDWHSVAPIKTGRLRNSVTLSKHKYAAGVKVTDDRFHLVNILNYSDHMYTKGFYTNWKNKYVKEFQDEALKK